MPCFQGADASIDGISDFNLNPAVEQVECVFLDLGTSEQALAGATAALRNGM